MTTRIDTGQEPRTKANKLHFNRDGTFESPLENHGTWSVEGNKNLKMSWKSICNPKYEEEFEFV
jgi:hypothetical protein